MLICWDCGNSLTFVQTSQRGDRRTVDLTGGAPRLGEWIAAAAQAPGLRCGECSEPIDEDVPPELRDARPQTADPTTTELQDLLERLLPVLANQEVRELLRPAREATFAAIPPQLDPMVRALLSERVGPELYSHQATAIAHALAGRHVVQATSAGSGKSLGFLAPVFDALVRSTRSTALLLYPAAGLVSDQLAALRGWGTVSDVADGAFDLQLSDEVHLRVGRHDGASSSTTRSALRRSGRIVLATPDSLHAAILRFGHHRYADGTSWGRFLRGLSHVIVDEAHRYSGAFGSAVAMTLRRLRRMVASHGGGEPTFLAASATIGNPGELIGRLAGVDDVRVVDQDGSPHRERALLIVQPNADTTGEALGTELVEAAAGSPAGTPLRTLVFAPSRQSVDRIAGQCKRGLRSSGWDRTDERIVAYRGTLDHESRAMADASLRDGTALAIVSTNALELGIDVASLHVGVLIGLPPNGASFEQQAGRVGRSGPGVVVLIVGDQPLERFVVNDSERFEDWLRDVRPNVVIDPENPEVIRLFGIVPGQVELEGIAVTDERYFGTEPVQDWLLGAFGAPTNLIGGEPHFSVELGVGEPHQAIRASVGGERFEIEVASRSEADRRRVGQLDRLSAMVEAYPGAIWRDGKGRTHRVRSYDLHDLRIVVAPTDDASGWSRGVLETDIEVLDELAPSLRREGSTVGYRSLRVTYRATRSRVVDHLGTRWEPIGDPWPPLTTLTTGLVADIDRGWYPDPDDHELATNGIAAAIGAVVPMLVATDPGDVEVTAAGRRLTVHDRAGTFRWTRPLLDRFVELAALAWQLTDACPCSSDGCPGCVVRNDWSPASKAQTGALLRRIVTAFAL